MDEREFAEQFIAYMVRCAGFTHFDDGQSVADYAADTAPSYWEDNSMREDGPEGCASADMSYWGEQ